MTDTPRGSVTFNGALETGLRSLVLLTACHPATLDLQKLLQFDYLLVHSGDVGGPESLHPPLPLRSGELLVRRGLIEKGLLLMSSRHLACRLPTVDGMEYQAEDAAGPFLDSLTSPYVMKLSERASWVISQFGKASTEEMKGTLRSFFDKWTSEFQSFERSHGADQ